jgi:hypothetical protein
MIRYAALVQGFPWRDALKGKHDAELEAATKNLRIKMIGSDQLDRVDPLGMIMREALLLRDEFMIPPLIVIDYVQLLARGTEDGMRARVSELTMRIRVMAQSLDCPIVAVFSTGRGFYGSKLEQLREAQDPTVYLGSAKESGDIEYDCATLLFLDVDLLHQGVPKPARVVVARCRVGDIGAAGYRAHLDSGKWDPDPLACVEIMSTERKVLRRAAEDASDEQHVLAAVRKNPGAAWNHIRNHLLRGIVGHDRADAAKARLMQTDRPVPKLALTTTYDANARKKESLLVVE